jgi:hypothetical protein
MRRMGAVLADDLQIGLPHVGADEADLRCPFIVDDREESLKAFYVPLPADPQQAFASE